MILAVVVVELPVWVVALFVIGVLSMPVAMFALLDRRMGIIIPAAMERSRRRNRRESGAPPPRRRTQSDTSAAPDPWSDEDTTDMHELVELERENQRKPRRRPGERPPARGTHHDR